MSVWKKWFQVLLVMMLVLSLMAPAAVQVSAEEPESELLNELDAQPVSSEPSEIEGIKDSGKNSEEIGSTESEHKEGSTEAGQTEEVQGPKEGEEVEQVTKTEEQTEIDKEVVHVQSLIDALPTVEQLDDTYEKQLVDARAAFDLLTEEQQKQITNVSLLTELEEMLTKINAQPVVLQQEKPTEDAISDLVHYFSSHAPSISSARSYTALDIETEFLLGLKGAGIDIASFNWGEMNSPFDEGTFWTNGLLPAELPKNNPYYLNALLGAYVLKVNPFNAFGDKDLLKQLRKSLSTTGSKSGTFTSLTFEQSIETLLALDVIGVDQLDLNPDYTLDYVFDSQYNSQTGLVSKQLYNTAWAMILGGQYPEFLNGNYTLTVWSNKHFDENPFNTTIAYLKENPKLIKDANVLTVATLVSGLVAIGEDVNDPSWPLGDNGELMSIIDYLVSLQDEHGSFGSDEDNVAALIALGDVKAGQTIYERLKKLKNITKTIQLRVEGPTETLFDGPVTVTDYPEVTLEKLVTAAVPSIDLNEENGQAKWYYTTKASYTHEHSNSLSDFSLDVYAGDEVIVYYGAHNAAKDSVLPVEDITFTKAITLKTPQEIMAGEPFTIQVTAKYSDYDSAGKIKTNGYEKTHNISGAKVTFNGDVYTTNADGIVEIPGEKAQFGDYEIRVSKDIEGSYPRMLRQAKKIIIQKDETPEKDIQVIIEGPTKKLHEVTVTLKENKTVYDASIQAFKQLNIPYKATSGTGIITAIDGIEQSAFEGWDGWNYTTNNIVYSLNNIKDQYLKGIDQIVWYYGADGDLYEGSNSLDENMTVKPFLTVVGEAREGHDLTLQLTAQHRTYDLNYNLVSEKTIVNLAGATVHYNGKSYISDEKGQVIIPGEQVKQNVTSFEVSQYVEDSYPKVVRTDFTIQIAAPELGNTKFIVPEDAELFIGQKPIDAQKREVHFVQFTEQKPETVMTADGLKTYAFNLKEGATYNYRVSQQSKLTNTGIFTATGQNQTLEITKEQLEIVSPKAILNKGTNLEGNIYLNINEQNHLQLNEGEEFKLLPLRSWQALIEGISNYFFEPDYHYEIIQGDDVVAITPGQPGSYATVNALKKGTAIVKVTYDALKVNGSSYIKDANDAFSAIWPENVGLFVVTVGQGETTIQTGIESNKDRNQKANTSGIKNLQNGVFDADIDSVYYMEGEKGAYYTFTPSADSKVTVLRPQINHAAGTVSYNDFSTADVLTNEDGSTSVLLLEGRNIVKVEKDGKAVYHVMTARPLGVQIENITNPSEKISAGDKVTVTFSGLSFPANKLAGVYNFQGKVSFVGGPEKAKITGKAVQYNLTTTGNSVTFTIPKNHEGNYVLRDGHIALSFFGNPIGDHRNINPLVGKNPNLNAVAVEGYYSIIPDITIISDEKMEIVDKTTLQETIQQAELHKLSVKVSSDGLEIDKENYWITEQELANFEAVLTVAKQQVNQATTQQQIDAQVLALQQALTKLKQIEKPGGKSEQVPPTLPDDNDNGSNDEGEPQPNTGNAATLSIVVPNVKIILPTDQFNIEADETAYSLLKRVTLEKQIALNDSFNSMGAYITGIDGVHAFDYGSLSGWMYRVNGVFPEVSADAFSVKAGDIVEWLYTTDAGNDIGGGVTDPEEDNDNPEKVPEQPDNQPSIVKEIEQTVQQAIKQPVSFGSEWDVIALARSHVALPDTFFNKYFEQVVQKTIESNGVFSGPRTEHSRVILALSAIGKDATNVGGYNLFEPLHDFNRVTAQGINGSIFALLAFDAQNYTPKFASFGRFAALTVDTSNFTTREKLVQHILSSELNDGGFALSGTKADSDVTAMALQALAPYKTNSDVQAAINRALTVLSEQQLANAGFVSNGAENVQSAAQVLIALSTLNIDAATDARFVKNGHTILNNIHTFATENGGYKHPKDGAENAMATQQAMQGLIAYERFVSGKPSLFSMKDVTIKVPEKPIDQEKPEQEKPAVPTPPQVSEQTGTVSTTIKINAQSTPLAMTSVGIQKGDTAFDVLLRITNKNGIPLSYRSTAYGIYIDGIAGVYEFDQGPLSGWMYRVNGVFPAYSADLYTLQPNDVVEWLYTKDLGKDVGGYVEDKPETKPNEEVKQPGTDEKQPSTNEVIDLTKENSEWKLDRATLEQYMGQEHITLQVAPQVVVQLPVAALKQLDLQEDEFVDVMVDIQGKTISTSILVRNGETKKQWTTGKNYATVKISKLLTSENSVVAQRIKGELRAVPHTIHNGEIIIFTKGSGEFTVIEKSVTFNDILKHANKADIEYLANRFIVNGKDAEIYAPNAAITRAQFGAMISRALGLSANELSVFTDTKGKWYEEELQALFEAGITKGKTALTFDPEAKMTRQQAAAFMANVLAYVGYKGQSVELLPYKDASTIQAQYKDAVALLYSLEIMTGKEDGTFDANGQLTRGQMAKILKRTLQIAGLL